MNSVQMPTIVSSTDIRYRFNKIAREVIRTGIPAVVVHKSRPLVKIHPYTNGSLTYSLQIPGDEGDLAKHVKKYAKYLKGIDSVAEIRRWRGAGWNLSSTHR